MKDPIAFSLLGIDIRWYGIIIGIAILVASAISYKKAQKNNINPEVILDIVLYSVPMGIVGARIYYVIFNWQYYSQNLGAIFDIRSGGLAIHGGLILGITTGYIVCRCKQLNFIKLLDLIIPQIALAQSIGRWGNYVNQEAYGTKTNLPWAIEINGSKVHPTFLYESIWCLILFFLLSYMFKRKTFDGQILCIYGILYSLERYFVEGLRTDSLMIGSFRQAQVLSICAIIVFILLYAILYKKNKFDKGDNHI